jgi:hypothetical protein
MTKIIILYVIFLSFVNLTFKRLELLSFDNLALYAKKTDKSSTQFSRENIYRPTERQAK